MDNTSRDAAAAKKAGMSYGKWKILHPETAPKKSEKKPMYHRVCPECGDEFDTDKWDKLYCCPAHAHTYSAREYYKRKKAKMNAMS